MPKINLGLQKLTDTGTTQIYPLGTLFEEATETHPTATIKQHGPRIWRYVKNSEGATAFAAGNPIIRKTGLAGSGMEGVIATTTASSKDVYLGVAQHAIAAGSYGWILVKGAGTYLANAGGAVTVDQNLIIGGTNGTYGSQTITTAQITAATVSHGPVLTGALASATGYAYFRYE